MHAMEKKKQKDKEEGLEVETDKSEANRNEYKPVEDVKEMNFESDEKEEKEVKHYKSADEALDTIGQRLAEKQFARNMKKGKSAEQQLAESNNKLKQVAEENDGKPVLSEDEI